jgi:hypothetical protein
MKKYPQTLLLICCSLFILSCNKKEDDSNTYSYENTETIIGIGYMKSRLNPFNGLVNYEIYLVPLNITYITALDTFEGEGNILNFNVFSNTGDRPTTGLYNWSDEKDYYVQENIQPFLKANIKKSNGEEAILKGGSVDIGLDNNINTLDFDLTDQNGDVLKGSFQGILIRI